MAESDDDGVGKGGAWCRRSDPPDMRWMRGLGGRLLLVASGTAGAPVVIFSCAPSGAPIVIFSCAPYVYLRFIYLLVASGRAGAPISA